MNRFKNAQINEKATIYVMWNYNEELRGLFPHLNENDINMACEYIDSELIHSIRNIFISIYDIRTQDAIDSSRQSQFGRSLQHLIKKLVLENNNITDLDTYASIPLRKICEIKQWKIARLFLHFLVNEGDRLASNQLAMFYLNGWDCRIDTALAIQLLEQAATAGIGQAMYSLGYVYHTGYQGAPVNTQYAKQMYLKAANAGVKDADGMLSIFNEVLFGKEKLSSYHDTLAKPNFKILYPDSRSGTSFLEKEVLRQSIKEAVLKKYTPPKR